MFVPELVLQHGCDWAGEDVTGWIASEKFDGCRAYWDGETLWSRTGCRIDAPDWFLNSLPKGVELDGEIWAGRGNLQAARLATQYGGKHFTDAIKFVVFDVPRHTGDWIFRISRASMFKNESVKVPTVWAINGANHALENFSAIKNAGGEGLMLRNPSIQYAAGRTRELLKVKNESQFARR